MFKQTRIVLGLFVALLIIVGCAPAPTPIPTPVPATATPVPSATRIPATATPMPIATTTPTAIPPTATLTPTVAPSVTPTPRTDKVLNTYTLPNLPIAQVQNAALANSVRNDRNLLLGGVGSDLWRNASDPAGQFWMVTDRGPNGQIKVGDETRRTFPIPEFTPLILRVQTQGDTFQIVQTIPLLTQAGKPVTGLSNIDKFDETPYDYAAQNKIALDPNGLDTEGLVRLSNGDFWLCDEYTPSLLRVGKDGKIIKRYIPEGSALTGTDYPVTTAFPAIYNKRKGNRGFEALAVSADEKTLYVGLQSPLSNPDSKIGNASRNTRILVFDLASEKVTAEYVYRFDAIKDFDPQPNLAASEMKISALVWVNATTLLVEERTDWVAKLYLVDLGKATNILGSKWNDAKTMPTLEALDDLAANSITALPKTLLIDLSKVPGVPDKIEGVAIIDKNTLAIANDNDFDIGDFDAQGNNVGKNTKSKILVISLAKPLP